jgi:N-hydroxyarylamine O-acetyltransferase
MNGLFGAMLEAIGFRVTRIAGGAHRAAKGDAMVGNHLVLRVDLDDEPWIAEVGFGDGPLEPFRLRAGGFKSAGFDFGLERAADGWWRFQHHVHGSVPSFDFRNEPADPALLAEKCAWLQQAPESPFVLTATCQRFSDDGYRILRGRMLKRIRPSGMEERLIDSAAELVAILKSHFDIDLPDAASLWPRICARHKAQHVQTRDGGASAALEAWW